MPLKSSYSDQLKKTDQSLIALLSDRISLLASEQPSLDEQLADVAPLLAQAGIPESVWVGVVRSCHASIPKSATNHIIPRQVTIIGGRGRMGRLFKEQLSLVGHNVSVLEAESAFARLNGINSVPFFIMNNQVKVNGSHSVEAFLEALNSPSDYKSRLYKQNPPPWV
ncbi:hypothetical protein [Nostoc sp. TCL240-02]|uniref:hypothetical protein n=1 Tax=Nostoc sp. TCL240-02 TaxID=2572090 RepID=UPI001598C9D4|nr:hypothetical protein [Nostoc sp. TCL240-02]QKQ74143.1 hypothetical protein FBB35_13160 [Nostoc sp. TCL240-02]